jgi:hypothetical protein
VEPPSFDELSDRAAALASVGRLEAAEAGLRAVLAAAPGHDRARANLAQVLLAQGRYAEAGPYHEARHAVRVGHRPKPVFPYPEWAGEDLAGKGLMIFPEQGLGDEIMMARFAPHLAARGADVTLICAPALERLFARCLAGVRVLAARGEVSFPDPDYWTMQAGLLTAGGWTPETLPGAPYLWAQARPGGGRIGVKAQGSPAHANDANRTLPEPLARELLALPGAVDLDPASTGAADLQDTAEIVAGLDLVITVDTSAAHLAGAMGKPVWILLPAVSVDWRWLRERTDSPWYPSARLFRQAPGEGWAGVLRRVREALGRAG